MKKAVPMCGGLHSSDDLLVAKDLWWWKKAMKSVQAAKARSGSYAHLPSSPPKSQLTGATICDDVSSRGLQNPKSSKASGDTNAKEDICIPAIYDKVVTLDLNLSIQTNKQTNCLLIWQKVAIF